MAFPTTPIFETFTGTDGTNPPNRDWTTPAVDTAPVNDIGLQITGNQLTLNEPAGNRGGIYYNPRSDIGPDVELYCTVSTVDPSNGGDVNLWVRFSNPGPNHIGYQLAVVGNVGGTAMDGWFLYSVVSGTATQIGTTSQAIAAGDAIGVSAVGSTITAWWKPSGSTWRSMLTATDTAIIGAGSVAVHISSFVTTPCKCDDMGGGTVRGHQLVPIRRLNYKIGRPASRNRARRFRQQVWTPSSTGTVFQQTLTATSVTTATIQNQVNKILSATSLTTASIVKQVNKIVSATSTSTATIIKQVNTSFSATATSTASIIRQVGKILSATSTTTATFVNQIGKVLNPTVTTTATFVRQVNKILSATATTTASIIKQVNKNLSATSTTTAVLTAIKVILVTMTATVTTTASMVRSIGKLLTSTVTTTATINKLIAHALTATSVTTATLIAIFKSGSAAAKKIYQTIVIGRF